MDVFIYVLFVVFTIMYYMHYVCSNIHRRHVVSCVVLILSENWAHMARASVAVDGNTLAAGLPLPESPPPTLEPSGAAPTAPTISAVTGASWGPIVDG
jgi:hypothetical protein